MSDVVQDVASPPRYDTRTIVAHWLTAALVILLWCLGQTIDFFPRGTPRTMARSVHICTGVLLACVFFYRVWWRITAGRHLPPVGARLIRITSTLAHWALYALVLTTVVLGLANAWIRGDTIFNLFKIASLAPGDKELRETVENLHGLSANALLILAALHAAAGLVHHYLWKDNVLRRMLPGLRPES